MLQQFMLHKCTAFMHTAAWQTNLFVFINGNLAVESILLELFDHGV